MRLITASLLLASMITAPALAEELFKTGPELQVNTYTTGQQGFPEVAVGPNGEYVVTWEGNGNQDGSSWGVFAQMYNPDGSPSGGEIQVNTTTLDTQWDPSVAIDSQGRFVIAWQGFVDNTEDFNVFAQRFDSSGMPLGAEFQANSFTDDYQGNTTVATSDNGDFLIVWESDSQDLSDGGVYGQLYDASGTPLGDELRINDTTAGDQNDVRVAAVDGGFAVTWESFLQDGSDESTILRFLDAGGAPDGGEIIVNSETLNDQEDPDVAVAADGSIAVVWEGSGQDGFGEGIFGQILDSDGAPISPEFQINTFTSQDQKNPRVSVDGTGGFVAVWTSELQVDGVSDDIFGQRFDTAGALVGGEFQVNSQATADQDVQNIAGGPGRAVMVAWRSFGGHDGDGAGVFAQRFEIGVFADGFESADTTAWSLTVLGGP